MALTHGIKPIVTSGLVLCLDAGNSKSYPGTGATWTDLSGNGRNGTLVNGPTYSSANGGSILFDGVNDYVTSTVAFTAGQAVTISGWLYSTETTSAYRNFVDSINQRPMIWWNNSGQIEFDANGHTTISVYRNQWVYITLVKPSGTTVASYYVNGAIASNGGVSYSVLASTPTWLNRGASSTWKGNCSIIQAYNRALTATEVAQNYDALKSRYGLT